MILLGVLTAGFGLLLIVARDFFWGITHLNNQFSGVRSERTELWDTGQIISGIVLILIGVGVICVGVGEAQTQARENEQATATAMTALAALNAAFGAHLAEWQQVDGRETVSVDPADLGIDARRILYGRCGGNGFYLYVVAFEGQYNDYVYLANTSEPRNCGPERAQVMFVEPIGGGWYDVTLAGSLDRFGTPTATRMPPTLVPSATPVYIIVTATPVEPIIITATPASEAEATPDQ